MSKSPTVSLEGDRLTTSLHARRPRAKTHYTSLPLICQVFPRPLGISDRPASGHHGQVVRLLALPNDDEPSVSREVARDLRVGVPDRLRLARLRMPAYLSLQVVDRLAPEEREILEEADDVGVASVEPELVHLVGRGLRGVEPHGPALGLPELRPIRFLDQRQRQAERGRALHPADEVRPGGDITPLVAAADLHRAAVLPEQAQEVVRLPHLVAELRIRETRVCPANAGSNRLAGQHDT